MLIHPEANGTEVSGPLPYEAKPESVGRRMNRQDRIAALSTFPCDECGKEITKDEAQHYEDETARCRPCADSLTRKPNKP